MNFSGQRAIAPASSLTVLTCTRDAMSQPRRQRGRLELELLLHPVLPYFHSSARPSAAHPHETKQVVTRTKHGESGTSKPLSLLRLRLSGTMTIPAPVFQRTHLDRFGTMPRAYIVRFNASVYWRHLQRSWRGTASSERRTLDAAACDTSTRRMAPALARTDVHSVIIRGALVVL